MHVRCPHCHSRAEPEGHDFLQFNCPACGRLVNLISGDDTTCQRSDAGRTIGHFDLVQEVGTGAFGSVWKARDTELDRTVALKIPRGDHLNAIQVDAFFREARAAAQLRHPQIVGVHEVGRDADTIFIVSDFVEGVNLKEWLASKRLLPRSAAELLAKVSDAVHHAHTSGVVHRDLKPGNIMLDADGEPHITDFGLAKREQGETTITVEGRILGTPFYMPPEQAKGEGHHADCRSDIYSLGVILFEVLTGELPFRGESQAVLIQIQCDDPPRPRKLNARIPRDLETITLKCLEKEPAKRYQTAAALANDLRRWLRGQSILARPVGRMERGWRWCRRNPMSATLAVVSVLALFSIGTGCAFYALYAQQVARVATRDLFEREAFHNTKVEVQDLINRGQQAMNSKRLPLAELCFAKALAKVGTDTRMETLRIAASHLLDRVTESLADEAACNEARSMLSRLESNRDLALFHGSGYTGQEATADLVATRNAATAGLALFGLDDPLRTTPQFDAQHFDPEDSGKIVNHCYELILILADAASRPLSRNENPVDQAKLALVRLDQAAKLLGGTTQAWHLQRADYLAKAREPQGASSELQLAADSQLCSATAMDFFLLGKQCMGQEGAGPEEIAQAMDHFAAVLRRDPAHFWAQYFTAVCHLRLQHWDSALAHLTACANGRPDFPWVHILSGSAEGQLGYFEAAEEDFEKALNQPGSSDDVRYAALVNRGVMRWRQGNTNNGIDDLAQATKLKPQEFQAYLNLAQVQQQADNFSEAAEHFDKAIALQPKMALLFRSRAELLLVQQKLEPALRDCDTAIQFESAHSGCQADNYVLRGRVLQMQSHFDAALEAFDMALALSPGDPRVQALRGKLLTSLERWDSALEALNAAIERGPATTDVQMTRGLVRAVNGDLAGAIDDYSRVLESDPSSSMHAKRGWLYLLSGAHRIAANDFEEAIRLDAKNPMAHAGRGLALAGMGQLKEAIVHAEQSLRIGPETDRTLYRAARIYAQASDWVTRNRVDQMSNASTLAQEYRQRAVALIEAALEKCPPQRRRQFWSQCVQADPLFATVHHSPRLARFAAQISGQE